MMKRAVTFTKHHTPNSVRVVARRVMSASHNARLQLAVPVETRSEYENIFHCTIRKTASQWIKSLLSDPIVYRYSGLLPHDPRPHKWRYPQALPRDRVVSSLFVSHKAFMTIPKPERYRAIFILRDPRDIVVSGYFSYRNTHTAMGDIMEVRSALREKTFKDGLLHVIQYLQDKGTFRALRSWATAPPTDAVRLFRYEDLTGERQAEEVDQMMRHCGISIPPSELAALLSRYSFSRMRGGGEAVASVSHYRKGAAGDWRNHFDDDIYEVFAETTGNLVELLGYPARDSSPSAERAQDS
ncbi:sulfotransferase domain-containing protein [Plantactinospora solaniradicis]|uniref:Sulfotransferase domain-containing protein n=1 Tax=Plantactinospora solaniradicis TaxID=1723736 RepID=A0ABW1K430_9ACTN